MKNIFVHKTKTVISVYKINSPQKLWKHTFDHKSVFQIYSNQAHNSFYINIFWTRAFTYIFFLRKHKILFMKHTVDIQIDLGYMARDTLLWQNKMFSAHFKYPKEFSYHRITQGIHLIINDIIYDLNKNICACLFLLSSWCIHQILL